MDGAHLLWQPENYRCDELNNISALKFADTLASKFTCDTLHRRSIHRSHHRQTQAKLYRRSYGYKVRDEIARINHSRQGTRRYQ